jgi:hypothetical protein
MTLYFRVGPSDSFFFNEKKYINIFWQNKIKNRPLLFPSLFSHTFFPLIFSHICQTKKSLTSPKNHSHSHKTKNHYLERKKKSFISLTITHPPNPLITHQDHNGLNLPSPKSPWIELSHTKTPIFTLILYLFTFISTSNKP